MAFLLLAVGLPTIFYVLLSTHWAQERIRAAADEALERVLGTEVEIGSIGLSPFNRLWICDVTVKDDNGQSAMTISRVETRLELFDLLMYQRLIIDYVAIDRLDASISRATPDSPLNIDRIIKKLASDDTTKRDKHFDLRLNDVSISDSRLSYTVESASETPGRFNPQRIVVEGLNVAVYAHELSSDTISATLQRLQLTEQSGLQLNNMSCRMSMSHNGMWLNDLSIQLPGTEIKAHAHTTTVPAGLGNGYAFISQLGHQVPIWVEVDGESHIYMPDLAPFMPALANAKQSVNLAVDIVGTVNDMEIRTLTIRDRLLGLTASAEGKLSNTKREATDTDPVRWILGGDMDVKIESNSIAVCNLLNNMGINVSRQGEQLLRNLGQVSITASANGDTDDATVDLVAKSASGDIDVGGRIMQLNGRTAITADAYFDDFNLGALLGNDKIGAISGAADIDGAIQGKKLLGIAHTQIDHIRLLGYDYQDVSASVNLADTLSTATLAVNDPNAQVSIDLTDRLHHGYHRTSGMAHIDRLNLDTLNLWHRFPGHNLSADLQLHGEGAGLDKFRTQLDIDGLKYVDNADKGLKIKSLSVDANTLGEFDEIDITSDIINGNIQGQIDLSSIANEIKAMAATIMPEVVSAPVKKAKKHKSFDFDDILWSGAETLEQAPNNNFSFDITVANAEDLSRFFGVSYMIIDPVNINGGVNSTKGTAWASVDAPYLLNGNNLQRNTLAYANIDAVKRTSYVYATTLMPTKKGDMDLIVTVNGNGNTLSTNVDWNIIRDIPINGKFNFATTLFKNSDVSNALAVLVNFYPGQINFGSDVWNINPSQITYSDKMLDVNGFALNTDTQRISIEGRASQLATDSMTVTLDKVNLLDIFENLNIDNALIGGQASGHIYANAVFGDSLSVESPDLFVKNIGYNRCTLGDGDIKVHYDRDEGDFEFDATIHQPDGRESYILGSLYPAREALDFTFLADHVRVGFMQTFMQAFASHVDGYASGRAHLFGTFKDINLEGDVLADSLSIRIDFTNTLYSAVGDSIHIRPGIIDLQDITIRDIYGSPARLNGWVKHNYFHEPVFDFSVSEARNFLSYDVTPKESPDWYGRIFGNGGAHVSGYPGVVNIGVNMSTAPNSTFTFVLSDTEEASEYSFITFRDVTPHEIVDSIVDVVIVPKSVQIHRGMMHLNGNDAPTAYNMDIQIDITPLAQMNIIMDPVGGDRIRGYGSGHLRMTYGSANNDLRMYGTYILEKGSYNFTLQDIIIKDFTIKDGSSITFTGDPYTAQLNIDAIYQVNANLSDLDKSFLQDKELNRTNVPVHAVLKVTGNMMQPDIDFDLEFPTLTVDTYRKVRSIVSTEEMMNMQIIYLLALNRFYTPEYMSSTTKGNELFSVASSTISSQLSSMLGKLSENWSIAPNLRSDRGDFSDLEVDLMLSSSLLNNRLLINGNFGYREKSLNANQFIGDFDIQYLLNRSGSWRLKAYNRFNDQNYYLRTAQTTQGVGVMYRRDFDNLFSFLKKKHKKKAETAPSKPVAEPDTLIIDETVIQLPQE